MIVEIYDALKDAGASEEKARRAAEAISSLDLSNIATKLDIADVRLGIEKVRLEIEKVRFEVAGTEARLIKWVIGVGVAAVIAVTGALSGVIWAVAQVLLRAFPHA
ncbi:MAG: hypothetical protein ACREEZ_03300 [Stellaceae bacterium]